MGIQSACNGRIDAGLHLERPLVRIACLVAKFKPSGRAISSTGKAYKFDRSVVEIIMNPIRVAVEILDHVERSSQDNQRHDFSRALVRIGLLDVAAEHPL